MMMKKTYNMTILVSGGGTNMQAVIDACEGGRLPRIKIVQVIGSRSDAYALVRAEKHGIPTEVIAKKDFESKEAHDAALAAALKEAGTDIVLLAGYMSVLSASIIRAYKGRIVNIHPSLIPKYCGKGFYGMHVHSAVIDGGESESGATVHYVDEGIDTGPVILQEKVAVLPTDTKEQLAARVLETEHKIIVEAMAMVVADIDKQEDK